MRTIKYSYDVLDSKDFNYVKQNLFEKMYVSRLFTTVKNLEHLRKREEHANKRKEYGMMSMEAEEGSRKVIM